MANFWQTLGSRSTPLTTHQAGSDAKSATKVGELRGTATEKKAEGPEKKGWFSKPYFVGGYVSFWGG